MQAVNNSTPAEAFDAIANVAGNIYPNTQQQKASSDDKPTVFLPTFCLDDDSPVFKATAQHRSDILFGDYQRAGAKLFRDGIAIPVFDTGGVLSGWGRYFQCIIRY